MLIQRTIRLTACAMIVLGCLVEAYAMTGRDALVGKWKATLTTDDGKETTDNITFKGGQFTSENETKDGYESATYDDDPAPAGMSAKFSVTLKNKAGDTAKWAGFSTGSQIDGTLVVTKKDGSVLNYTLKASK